MQLIVENEIPDLLAPHMKCGTCPIRHRAVCSKCEPTELAVLDKVKFYRDFEPGEEIVGEGEITEYLGSVVSGVVALQKTLEDGRRQIIGLLFASDFVGRPMRPTAPYDAIAITPVKMCLFHRKQFEQILTQNSHLENRLLEMTLDELDAAREWMVLLGRKTAKEKVSSFLLVLLARAASLSKKTPADGMVFEIPLTRESIAEFLGLTIETVSRQFTGLRREGVIDIKDARTVGVTDVTRLFAIAGREPDEFVWATDNQR